MNIKLAILGMEKLGQHFMIDGRFLKLIVDSAELKPKETVLEVGPGEGVLTKLLLEKCSVTAIEKDEELFMELRDKHRGLPLINGDVLKIEWPRFDKCVSNLPYSISKKFILKLVQHDFESAVIVVQREFAEKLVAKPGEKDYGVVSVCAQLACDVELLDRIPKNAFKPQPKVESQIVRLRKKAKMSQGLIDFVTLQFQTRNKKLGDKRIRDISPSEFLMLYVENKENE